MSSSDSSFSSSFFSSSFSAAAAGAPPVAPPATTAGAGPPPPEPTFDSSSFTFLPSRAFVSNAAHIGSISTPAASVRATILSACGIQIEELVEIEMFIGVPWMCVFGVGGTGRTVISMPSSARMRAAYVAADSDVVWKRKHEKVSKTQGFANRDICVCHGRTIRTRCRGCDVDATRVVERMCSRLWLGRAIHVYGRFRASSFSRFAMRFIVSRHFNSDVAQWLACRAHRHSPLPGGSSIETRRRYFLQSQPLIFLSRRVNRYQSRQKCLYFLSW